MAEIQKTGLSHLSVGIDAQFFCVEWLADGPIYRVGNLFGREAATGWSAEQLTSLLTFIAVVSVR